jgi:hypothetical protein
MLSRRLGDRGFSPASAQGATISPVGLPANKSLQSREPLGEASLASRQMMTVGVHS